MLFGENTKKKEWKRMRGLVKNTNMGMGKEVPGMIITTFPVVGVFSDNHPNAIMAIGTKTFPTMVLNVRRILLPLNISVR